MLAFDVSRIKKKTKEQKVRTQLFLWKKKEEEEFSTKNPYLKSNKNSNRFYLNFFFRSRSSYNKYISLVVWFGSVSSAVSTLLSSAYQQNIIFYYPPGNWSLPFLKVFWCSFAFWFWINISAMRTFKLIYIFMV